jgi:hypothetical protein
MHRNLPSETRNEVAPRNFTFICGFLELGHKILRKNHYGYEYKQLEELQEKTGRRRANPNLASGKEANLKVLVS